MLTPMGFWSYTSSDDERSRGRLSQLRKLLADELQQKIGRLPEVQILPGCGRRRRASAGTNT
jgi:hypothetical protein